MRGNRVQIDANLQIFVNFACINFRESYRKVGKHKWEKLEI